jgi:FKBP-type peptidyl-prolyl cis-trans isomerase FkpA
MNRIVIFLFIISLASLEACKDNEGDCTKVVPSTSLADIDQTRLANDIIAIDAYLLANGITAQTEPNGVRYVITQQGDGTTPCLENRVQVKYSGRLLKTGTVFDSNNTGATFKLNGLILGWQMVLPLVKAGSKVTLYIPSGYGYGEEGAGGGTIPSNANLIFEIELTGIR